MFVIHNPFNIIKDQLDEPLGAAMLNFINESVPSKLMMFETRPFPLPYKFILSQYPTVSCPSSKHWYAK